MQDKLVDFYINKSKIKIVDTELHLISNVNSDNVIETLNEIYNFDWCYEVIDVKEILNKVCLNVVLYTPGRIFSKIYASKNFDNSVINELLATALKDMYKNISIFEGECKTIEETATEDTSIETTTLDKLEEEIKENEIKKESPSPSKNQYGIRKDQIDFMNEFKAKYNIDNDEKFNYYIKTWSDNTGREISTKKELVTAGEEYVDKFIKWVSIIEIDKNTSSINISSPI